MLSQVTRGGSTGRLRKGGGKKLPILSLLFFTVLMTVVIVIDMGHAKIL